MEELPPGICVEWSKELGRFLVAMKEYEAGELIFIEKAVMTSPVMDSMDRPTCLSCCKVLNQGIEQCAICKWPVCDNGKCYRNIFHSDFECRLFAEKKIPPLLTPQRYQLIQFLRCCLLQETNPRLFSQLMELQSHSVDNHLVQRAFAFIHDVCELSYVNLELMERIISICLVNSFAADSTTTSSGSGIEILERGCTLLFSKLSLLNHHCSPNARIIFLDQSPNKAQNVEFFGELRATTKISKGQPITIQYVNLLEGTIARRQALYENWSFHCFCDRCTDPIEYGSYFSAVKCVICTVDYSLPIIADKEIYICQNCGTLKSIGEIDTIIQSINDEIVKACLLKSKQKVLTRLEKILECSTDSVLHPNHYVLNSIRYKMICISTSTHIVDLNTSLVKKLLSYINKLIYIANIIYPGLNTYRSFLCYHYVRLLKFYHGPSVIKEYMGFKCFRNLIIDAITTLRLEPDPCHGVMSNELTQFYDMYMMRKK